MTGRQAIPRGAWMMVAALWGLFLAGMYHWDKLKFFQASPYIYFTGAAGVVLLVLALKGTLWPATTACGCGHHHAAGETCPSEPDAGDDHDESPAQAGPGMWAMIKGIVLVTIIMLPALSGILVPHRSLNAMAALQRGMNIDSSNLLEVYRSDIRKWATGASGYQEVTALDVLEIGQQKPDAAMKVQIQGIVVRPTQLAGEKDLIAVVRFKMTCCAADATPISVPVRVVSNGELPAIETLDEDTWVEVRGIVCREKLLGKEMTVIVVNRAPLKDAAADSAAGDATTGESSTPQPATDAEQPNVSTPQAGADADATQPGPADVPRDGDGVRAMTEPPPNPYI